MKAEKAKDQPQTECALPTNDFSESQTSNTKQILLWEFPQVRPSQQLERFGVKLSRTVLRGFSERKPAVLTDV